MNVEVSPIKQQQNHKITSHRTICSVSKYDGLCKHIYKVVVLKKEDNLCVMLSSHFRNLTNKYFCQIYHVFSKHIFNKCSFNGDELLTRIIIEIKIKLMTSAEIRPSFSSLNLELLADLFAALDVQ